MTTVPPFDADGLLPASDYELSFDELRGSMLVFGPGDPAYPSWDKPWREGLANNLETLTRQLWQVGIREIFADGSFAEDKEHPNDIDGYFECDLQYLASGELERKLNLLDPSKVWTRRREGRTVDTPRNSFRCGIDTVWSCIRMCQVWGWAAASWTSMVTNWNFPPLFASAAAMANRGAS